MGIPNSHGGRNVDRQRTSPRRAAIARRAQQAAIAFEKHTDKSVMMLALRDAICAYEAYIEAALAAKGA